MVTVAVGGASAIVKPVRVPMLDGVGMDVVAGAVIAGWMRFRVWAQAQARERTRVTAASGACTYVQVHVQVWARVQEWARDRKDDSPKIPSTYSVFPTFYAISLDVPSPTSLRSKGGPSWDRPESRISMCACSARMCHVELLRQLRPRCNYFATRREVYFGARKTKLELSLGNIRILLVNF